MKNQKGFTIIELLVVVAIICVLSAVVLTSVFDYQEKSSEKIESNDINKFKCENYKDEFEFYKNTCL